jgi:hypothetical protein
VEFHKNLGRIGDIYVAYSKVDPSVSHIWKAVDAGALQVSARLLASPVPRHVAARSGFSQQRKMPPVDSKPSPTSDLRAPQAERSFRLTSNPFRKALSHSLRMERA